MTTIDRQNIKMLIQDLRPMDYVDLQTKRMNFIYGQGMIVYNDHYAVEIYIPRDKKENMTFFAVQSHFRSIETLGQYYRRLPVHHYTSTAVNSDIRRQFDEAIFQYRMEENNVHQLESRNTYKKGA